MKKNIIYIIVLLLIFINSSCIIYSDLALIKTHKKAELEIYFEDSLKNVHPIVTYHPDNKTIIPLLSSHIFDSYESEILSCQEKKNSQTKLCYYFHVQNRKLLHSNELILNSFYFINEENDTIPCIFNYGFGKLLVDLKSPDNLFYTSVNLPLKINLADFSNIDVWFDLLIISDCYYHQTSTIYVSYDIVFNGQRYVAEKLKYKRKIQITRFI